MNTSFDITPRCNIAPIAAKQVALLQSCKSVSIRVEGGEVVVKPAPALYERSVTLGKFSNPVEWLTSHEKYVSRNEVGV